MRKRSNHHSPRTCVICGGEYRPNHTDQQTCGRACGWELRKRNDQIRPPKMPRQKPVVPVEILAINVRQCAVCGSTFATTGRGQCCSTACSSRKYYTLKPPTTHVCGWCGESFTVVGKRVPGNRRSRFCSARCSKRHGRSERKQRLGQFHVTAATRTGIYQRDQWTCHLCGHPVSTTVHMSPWYPTLDHVVPRSQGGSDEADNLATAHLYCNSRRGTGPTVITWPYPPLHWPGHEPDWCDACWWGDWSTSGRRMASDLG